MAVFDVRIDVEEEITEIVFEDVSEDAAYKLKRRGFDMVGIIDSHEDVVIIQSEQHAQNLIKALNKAIEIGWLK